LHVLDPVFRGIAPCSCMAMKNASAGTGAARWPADGAHDYRWQGGYPTTAANASTAGTTNRARDGYFAHRLVWCHEHCHNVENRTRRQLIKQRFAEQQWGVTFLKKAQQFARWLEETDCENYILVVGWREAQPCVRALRQLRAMPPLMIVVVCISQKQYTRASVFSTSVAPAYADILHVCYYYSIPTVLFGGMIRECFGPLHGEVAAEEPILNQGAQADGDDVEILDPEAYQSVATDATSSTRLYPSRGHGHETSSGIASDASGSWEAAPIMPKVCTNQVAPQQIQTLHQVFQAVYGGGVRHDASVLSPPLQSPTPASCQGSPSAILPASRCGGVPRDVGYAGSVPEGYMNMDLPAASLGTPSVLNNARPAWVGSSHVMPPASAPQAPDSPPFDFEVYNASRCEPSLNGWLVMIKQQIAHT